MTRRRNDAGLTVIEALIAVGLGLLVVSTALGALFTSMRTWQRGEADAEVQGNLRLAVDQFSRDLRVARRINGTSNATRIEFVVPKRCGESPPGPLCPGLSPRDLDFRQNASGVFYVSDGQTIRYELSGADLVRSVNGVQTGRPRSPISECAGIPLFTYNAANPQNATAVFVALCGTATRRGGTVSSSSEVRMRVFLRNVGLPDS